MGIGKMSKMQSGNIRHAFSMIVCGSLSARTYTTPRSSSELNQFVGSL
jgi:hypothetical protein